MLRRRRMVFARQPRRWPLVVLAPAVLVAAIAAVILLARPSNIDLHGTFTMFQPLRCEHARPGDIFHTQMVFLGADGDVLGRVTVWRGARLTTESVRGFAHCREVGTYRIRLPKSSSYAIELPNVEQRIGPVSFEQLVGWRYRYDVFYCCGR